MPDDIRTDHVASQTERETGSSPDGRKAAEPK